MNRHHYGLAALLLSTALYASANADSAPKQGINAGGNINLSADNGGTNVINFNGITIDDHQRILSQREREIRAELAASSDTKSEAEIEKRIHLKIELEAVQGKLNNLAQSYKDSQQSLIEANQALTELKQQLPEAQFKQAQEQLQQGKTSTAKKAFITVRGQRIL